MSRMTISIDRTDTVENKPNETVVINDNPFDYVVVFDHTCEHWEPDHEYNKMRLRYVEHMADNMLTARGYLFLNEVYDMLGIPRTKIGQIAGLVKEDGKHIELGFGSKLNLRFIDGEINTFVVEPNVDGIILHRVY